MKRRVSTEPLFVTRQSHERQVRIVETVLTKQAYGWIGKTGPHRHKTALSSRGLLTHSYWCKRAGAGSASCSSPRRIALRLVCTKPIPAVTCDSVQIIDNPA